MGWTHGADIRLKLSMQWELIPVCSQSLSEQRGTAAPQLQGIISR